MPEKRKQPCDVGDRMGCGIEQMSGQQFVYFTKNGQTVGPYAFPCWIFDIAEVFECLEIPPNAVLGK